MQRSKMAMGKEVAKPKVRAETEEASVPSSSMGRLPSESLMLPRMGPEKNCAMLKQEPSSPA